MGNPFARAGFALAIAVIALSTIPARAHGQEMNKLTVAEQRAGWQLLFDGTTLNGWRGFKKGTAPAGWQAVDGELRRVSESGDLITDNKYRDFELDLDWKISAGGNSGIIYRVTEDANETYETGPEMQVLDDERHSDGKSLLTSAGSDFGLYPVPRHLSKPAGEWNHVRLIVRGNHVEHWLNGVEAVEYELGSADWKTRVAKSKFKAWPGYGKAAEGYVALQDHESPVAFRNIKIKVLQ